MILILLGTQDQSFDRILKAVSREIKNENIKDKVVAQVGKTSFKDEKIETFDFCSKDEVLKYIDDAKFIICHGGVGTITECIERGKKVIVVPRRKKYNEHVNDHQVQITKEFASNGYIIPLYDTKNLMEVINSIKDFKPKKYESNNEHFKEAIIKYIEN